MAIVADASGNSTFAPDFRADKIEQVNRSFTPAQSDTVDLKIPAQSILVGGAGDVKVTFVDGTVDTITLAAGIWHPIRNIKRIWSTGTTATGIRITY